ncbi:MAG: phosphoglycerate mutase [Desulfobacteraceae bacterium]|nr:MAG: phosphoglycerate mutase [Desulfobacteraceae bacterium]
MTTLLLIRHGHTAMVGNRLAGRSPGIHLSSQGEGEAAELVKSLSEVRIDAVFSSPLERTRETAQRISEASGKPVQVVENLVEIDYGEWTGRRIESLREDPVWIRYNRFRSTTRIPGGEWFVEVQDRVVKALEELRTQHAEQILAIVTHGDVIRVAISHYIAIPLDMITRLVVKPASVSALSLSDHAPELLFTNFRGATLSL